MDNNAVTILANSLQNIHKRTGQLTIANVEAEVINHSCFQILQCRRNGVMVDEMAIIDSFNQAALQLIEEFDEGKTLATTMGVHANLAWEGMWDFLRNYFQKTHGVSIDEAQSENQTYYSNKHARYENGTFVSESEVQRIVNLTFTNDRHEIMVTIEPALSPKTGIILTRESNKCIYNGTDPDYRFDIEFDEFDEVSLFTLYLVDRGVKIIYFE